MICKFWWFLSIHNIWNIQKYFSINGFATVTTSRGVLIIGGRGGPDNSDVATVACYNNSGWSRLDDLQEARRGYRAISNGQKIYLIGGIGTQYVLILA